MTEADVRKLKAPYVVVENKNIIVDERQNRTDEFILLDKKNKHAVVCVASKYDF